ncbi:hypothetical protein [Faecalibacillus faecis]|uniref:hypothetical protein n=1 Tax=Faecalibacillus faecis TaxID=1982628 RepID=UPI00386B67A1
MKEERILSLQKNSVNFSKLKLDVTNLWNLKKDTTFERIVKFIAKDYDETKNVPDNFIFEHECISSIFTIEQIDGECNKLKKFMKTGTETKYKFMYQKDTKEYCIYSVTNYDLPFSYRKKYFIDSTQKKNQRYEVMNIKYLWGLLKLLDMALTCTAKYDFIDQKFETISVFKNHYTEETIGYIKTFAQETRFSALCLIDDYSERYSITSQKRSTQIRKCRELLIDVVVLMRRNDINLQLTKKLEKNSKSDYAKSFQTKKDIPENITNIMKNTFFLKDFSYVELDQDIDIGKFRILENEWRKLREQLKYPFDKAPELRFRKLGQHKATGLYYPTFNCICIDIDNPSSFVHELSHYFDYTAKNTNLSLDYDFMPIAKIYEDRIRQYIKNNENETSKYLKNKLDYFLTPTEIFARMAEVYWVNKGIKHSLAPIKEELTINKGFPDIDDEYLKKIIEYFDNIFDKYCVDIQKDTDIFVNTEQIKLQNNNKIEIKPNKIGQFYFNF